LKDERRGALRGRSGVFGLTARAKINTAPRQPEDSITAEERQSSKVTSHPDRNTDMAVPIPYEEV
jgi:hypothetical protein